VSATAVLGANRTAWLFAWEERAVESSRFMLERIERYLAAPDAT
jgi:hypothetical protein